MLHPNTIDLTGQRFGNLVVLNISEERGNRGQIKWECLCDCGNKHVVTGESLRHGKTHSCGCLGRKPPSTKILDREYALWKKLYGKSIVRRNRQKGFETDIPLEEFIKLSKDKCFYCGVEPYHKMEDVDSNKPSRYVSDTVIYFNGIDRIDSNDIYRMGNVVTCCEYCNRAKNDLSTKEFKNWVKRIYTHMFNNIAKKRLENEFVSREKKSEQISLF